MTQKKFKVEKLTKALAGDIVDMLGEGKSAFEVYHRFGIHHTVFYSWIVDSIFGKAEDRTPEMNVIREGVLELLLAESVILQVLKILSEPQVTIKETELLALSAQDRKALERKGYERFVEDCEEKAVILKIEKTSEPPPVSLLEKLMKMVDDGNVDVVELKKQIIPFAPVHPDLPGVILLFAVLPPFFSFLF